MTTATFEFHSQPITRQDEWVIEKLGFKRNGYFVEAGAHNGLRHSNTLTLERMLGWTGILVEPNPKLYDRLIYNRPNCKHDRSVLADRTRQSQAFYMGHDHGDAFSGLVDTMPPEWQENHANHGSELRRVDTAPLRDVLMRHHAPRWIDYLSLDVEGAELAILQGFYAMPVGFDFRLITVEFRYDQVVLNQLQQLLDPWFVLDEVRAFDACFVHRSL